MSQMETFSPLSVCFETFFLQQTMVLVSSHPFAHFQVQYSHEMLHFNFVFLESVFPTFARVTLNQDHYTARAGLN